MEIKEEYKNKSFICGASFFSDIVKLFSRVSSSTQCASQSGHSVSDRKLWNDFSLGKVRRRMNGTLTMENKCFLLSSATDVS